MQAMLVGSLGREHPLKESMATHSSILAWRIPRTEEPGGLHTVHRVTKSWTQLKQLSTHACGMAWIVSSHLCKEGSTQTVHLFAHVSL